MYPEEVLNTSYNDEDDGTMVESRDRLAEAVVGHKIVKAEQVPNDGTSWHYGDQFEITLDNGKKVVMRNTSDCCAYTELRSFLLNVDKVDHMIMGVGTTDSYQTWHIYADMGDVLELEVGWSCGNAFYYGYGFDIEVVDA